MSAARLAAHCLELLGPVAGPVELVAPRRRHLATALDGACRASADRPPAAAIVVLLGVPARTAERQATLRALERRLPAGAPLLLVDHNQPRALARRVLATALLALRRMGPTRARYPAARELAALGFEVERLRLACGERVQLVLARRR